MTDFHLAEVNIGRIVAPLDSPALAGFVEQLDEINALADGAPGFVWRMVGEDGADATALRPDAADDRLLINCSVWESAEALRDFAYRSDHMRVLIRRREWFERSVEPYLALWWIPAGRVPTAAEAMRRIALLRENGPGPGAFTFRNPFPAPDAAPPAAESASGQLGLRIGRPAAR
ncbi:MAG TPA: DUF3291 domain-containing protein [Actinocrinis sp.]|jgi:hypothetical protein